MRKFQYLILLVALVCANTTVWADDFNVGTDAELRAAIQNDGANITVKANIDLSNSTLSIESGKTITIDLNGHTLDRKLNSRGEGGGQVITVRSGAKLYLSNGTLKGGWGGNGGGIANEGGTANLTNVTITDCTGDDRGGGICNYGTLTMTGGALTNNVSYDHTAPSGGGGLFNAEGATATLTGITITGNQACMSGGGGIFNNGTLYLYGVTIQNNTAGSGGGGIYSCNEKHLLKMQGANIITDNTAGGVPSNLFMEERRWITLTDPITGSRIGITLDVAPNQFTNGYATYHDGEDPNTFFTCDRLETDYLDLIPDEPHVLYVGELILKKMDLTGKVPYIERSWDSENEKVLFITKMLTEEIALNATPTSETQYKRLKSSPGDYLELGTEDSELHEYYVVSDEEVEFESLIVIGPNVHIILCDNAWLHLNSAVGVERANTVYFHAQSSGPSMGKLTSGSIGSSGPAQSNGVNIEIHGGKFDLQGNTSCAAIGGNYDKNGYITIFDGHIKAIGGDAAAGIGAGYGSSDYGNITIYGGTIDATGSAGIGGGQTCLNGKLTIWGGAITARGISEAAGIGSNQYSGDYGAGTITINGGYVRAYGDQYAAGIGGGDGIRGGTLNVNGGHVEAYGGTDAAGIGGGEGGNGGIVNITGGYVYAEGNDNGAGIGGGEDGAGADVTITGGVVIAKAGGNEDHPCAIGRGSDADNSDGSLTFADNLGVFITQNLYRSVKENRVSDCRNNQYVQINKCAHGGATASIYDGERHNISSCKWCYVTGYGYHSFGDYGECGVCGLISLSNNTDNNDRLDHWNNAEKSVVLSDRTLYKDGKWNTLCLPFALDNFEGTPLEDATVKTLNTTSLANGTLTMNFSDDNLTSIEAGKPYIVKWENGDDITNPVFMDVTIDNTTSNVETECADFIGNFSPVDFAAQDRTILYMGGDNKLYYPKKNMTIKSFRAFFDLGEDSGEAKEITDFVLNFGDSTTEIVNSQLSTVNSNDSWYSIDGRKLNGKPTQKGVYIHKGKKIVK